MVCWLQLAFTELHVHAVCVQFSRDIMNLSLHKENAETAMTKQLIIANR